MANIKSAKKRIATAEKKRVQNKSKKSELNTCIKKYKSAPSAELLQKCTSLLDKAVQDNIFHINKANRHKAKLSKMLDEAKK